MKKITFNPFQFTAIFVLCFLFSCSSDLSRSKAKELIKENENYKYLTDGYNIVSWSSSIRGLYFLKSTAFPKNKYSVEKLRKLQELGYVKVLFTLGDDQAYFELTSQSDSLKYSGSHCGYSQCIVIGNIDDVEVTGIKEQSETSRVAEGTLKYRMNTFGKTLTDNETYEKPFSITFIKYDDGWKVEY